MAKAKKTKYPVDSDFIVDGARDVHGIMDFEIGDIGPALEELESAKELDIDFIEYDQSKEKYTSYLCTMFAPKTMMSCRFKKRYDEDFTKAMFNHGVEKYGFVEGQGNATINGIKSYVETHNKLYPDRQLLYYFSDHLSKYTDLAVKKRFGVVMTHRGNRVYNEDTVDNNRILEGTDFGSSFTYGHALCQIQEEKVDGVLCRTNLNNYSHRGIYNRYFVPKSNIGSLVENNVFYSRTYIILEYAKIEEVTQLTFEEVKKLSLCKRMNSLLWQNIDMVEVQLKNASKDKKEYLAPLYRTMKENYHRNNETINSIEKKCNINLTKPL